MLKFIGNPQINIHNAFTVICEHVHSGEKSESPDTFPGKIKQGNTLPLCFSSHTIIMAYLVPLSFTFLWFVLVTLLFKMAPA